MLNLDHLTIIAPTLSEGVAHVQDCLELEIPFGTRHAYMGTHNHRLQLGDGVYLEIVARDPDGVAPNRARWFGVDDPVQVREDWETGKRLRGWVAATRAIEDLVARYPGFGEVVALPFVEPEFSFAIPVDGTLPKSGILPSLIDHRDDPTKMSDIPDLGARLVSFVLQHPDPVMVRTAYAELNIDRPPSVHLGPTLRYQAEIETPEGLRKLW